MKETYVDWTKFSSIVAMAMAKGVQPSSHKLEWDVSIGCHKPYPVILASRVPDNVSSPIQNMESGHTCWIHLETPCRKCERCLKNRQRLWRARMLTEFKQAPRSWMGTFTINPHMRFIFSLRAKSRDYHASHREIGKELTKYFKRLRKAGYRFRYVVVAEAHKDGYPHVHCLVHEVSTPIPKERLQAEWPHGFTTFKLVKSISAASYVAKYLAKDARTRIRASLLYGRSRPDLIADLYDILKS